MSHLAEQLSDAGPPQGAKAPSGGSEAHAVASVGAKSLIDHRVYTIALRKMPEFLEVFNRMALPLLMETLGHPVGFYTSLVGPLNQFVHLWAYDDLADYERRCRLRDTHPDFPAYLAASAHLITAQETRLIKAVDLPFFSNLKR
jgi:hypothetical protein